MYLLAEAEDKGDAQFFAECDLGGGLVGSVSPVAEEVGPQIAERLADRHIGRVARMLRHDHLINNTERLYNLFALLLWHKDDALLLLNPVIVVQNHEEPIAMPLRTLKEFNVPDMQRVKPPRDGHYSLFAFGLRLHSCVSYMKTAAPASALRNDPLHNK